MTSSELIISSKPLFPNKVTFKVSVVRTWAYLLGDTIQSTTGTKAYEFGLSPGSLPGTVTGEEVLVAGSSSLSF